MSAKADIDPEALAEAIVEHGSVRAACEALGVHRVSLWRRSQTDKELAATLWAARQCAAEMRWDECVEIADAATPEDAQTARLRIETRMRTAGKLMESVYGDKPQSVTNIQNNTAIVCDEATRERLLALRAKIDAARGRLTQATEAGA